MPKGKQGIFEALRAGVQSEEEIAIEALFPTKDKFKMLQMITHHQMSAQVPLAILGLFRRMYKSAALRTMQEELNINKIALDRLGRVELSEVVSAKRREKEKEED